VSSITPEACRSALTGRQVSGSSGAEHPRGKKRPMETISRQQLKAKLDAGEAIKLVMTVGG
jgi:hypothetical protein